mmetsp:Transcript_35326/g.64621  ORF Transcript_35326/g.64621 Transcript_35326/m.64621 type:complete len:627 (+) Transcript_35326:72-1952(+)
MYTSIALSPGEEQRYQQDAAKRLRCERVRQARHQATKLSQSTCRQVREVREHVMRQQEALEVQQALLSKTVEIEDLLEECSACQEVEGLALRAASAHAQVTAAADARQEQLATLRWKLEQLRAAESLHLNRHEILQQLSAIATKLEKQKQVRNVERQRANNRAKQGRATAAAATASKAADEEAAASAKAVRRHVLSDHRYGAVDYARTYYHVQCFAAQSSAPEVQVAEFDRSPSPPPQLTAAQQTQRRARSNSALMSVKAEQTVRDMKKSLDAQARLSAKAASVEAQVRARRECSVRASKAVAPEVGTERSQSALAARPAGRRPSPAGAQPSGNLASKTRSQQAHAAGGGKAKPNAEQVVRRLNEALLTSTPADTDEQNDARSEPKRDSMEQLPQNSTDAGNSSRLDADRVVGLLNEALFSSASEQMQEQVDARSARDRSGKPLSSTNCAKGGSSPRSAEQVVGLLNKAILLSEPAALEEDEGDDMDALSDSEKEHFIGVRTPEGSSPMPKANHLDGLLSEAQALLSGIVAPFDSILAPPNGTWLPSLERLPDCRDVPSVGAPAAVHAQALDDKGCSGVRPVGLDSTLEPRPSSSRSWRRHVRAHGEDLGLELEQICRDLHSAECA